MKENSTLKILILFSLLLCFGKLEAQVTIGANSEPKATLDVVAKNPAGLTVEGIIAPRLTGDQIKDRNALYGAAQEGVIIYATSAVSPPNTGKTEKITAAGYYYFDGSAWQSFSTGLKWFYMPSIVLDVSTENTFKRDLYLEYKKQFADAFDNTVDPLTSPNKGTAMVKSDVNAPDLFDKIYDVTELYYYVIGYDATVFFNVSVNASGILTYTITDAGKVSDETFMNIVFVVK